MANVKKRAHHKTKSADGVVDPEPVSRPKTPTGGDTVSAAASVASTPAKPTPVVTEASTGPFSSTLLKAGFRFAKTEVAGKFTAHAWLHADKRAVLVTVGPKGDHAWELRSPDGSTSSGTTEAMIVEGIKVSRAAILSTVAAAQKPASVPVPTPVSSLPPSNVVRAVQMLGSATRYTYSVHDLAGEKNYTKRVQLLKKLLGVEKVLVRDSGINALVAAFNSAVGVGDGSKAAKAEEFAKRCAAIVTAAHKARVQTVKEAAAKLAVIKRATYLDRVVPGVILEAPPKPKTKKQRLAERESAILEMRYLLATGEEPMAPNPHPYERLLPRTDIDALRLIQRRTKDGIISLVLEVANSQGALHIFDTGMRIALGVLTPTLAADYKDLPSSLTDVKEFLQTVEKSSSERSSEVKQVIQSVKRAISVKEGPVTLAVTASKDIKPPRELASEIRLVAGDVGLLEDPRLGIVMMQLEHENTQGAICVYNNGSRVAAGVVPPEILRTLRPVTGAVDLIKAANQLLNPLVPSVPVSPVAACHLTAVLNCKEIIMANATVSKKFEAPKNVATKSAVATPAKKTAAVKSTTVKATPANKAAKTESAVPRKASTYRLVNAAKTIWSAFGGQKKQIVDALVKLGAVGAKAPGVTAAALVDATGIGPKNVAFYMSVWQTKTDPAVIEKLAAE